MKLGELTKGLSYDDYDQAEGFRAGYLRSLLESPAHLYAHLMYPKKETEALRFGKLFHKALENPEKFMDMMISEPIFEGRTKKGEKTTNPNAIEVKEQKASWYASLPDGSIVVGANDREQLGGMVMSIGRHKYGRQLIKDGMREVSASVRDPVSGEILKFRPDLIAAAGFQIDYKSVRKGRSTKRYFLPSIFSDADYSPYYALSCAHYIYCAKLLRLERANELYYMAVEKERPWGMHIYAITQEEVWTEEEKRAKAMVSYAECKAKFGMDMSLWPGYPEAIVPAQRPSLYMGTHPLDEEANQEHEEQPQW